MVARCVPEHHVFAPPFCSRPVSHFLLRISQLHLSLIHASGLTSAFIHISEPRVARLESRPHWHLRDLCEVFSVSSSHYHAPCYSAHRAARVVCLTRLRCFWDLEIADKQARLGHVALLPLFLSDRLSIVPLSASRHSSAAKRKSCCACVPTPLRSGRRAEAQESFDRPSSRPSISLFFFSSGLALCVPLCFGNSNPNPALCIIMVRF